jgi:hypothetical protein
MVAFKFTLTEEEYFRYNYYTAWAAPRRKRYRILYFLKVIILYGAVALLYIIATNSHYVWIDISVFIITGSIYLMMIPFFVKRSIGRKVNDILSKEENQHVLDEAEIILSDTGIIDRDRLTESRYIWDAVVRHDETADSYYLYTNSYHAIVIPKRVIGDVSEQQEMERLLRTHLPLHA